MPNPRPHGRVPKPRLRRAYTMLCMLLCSLMNALKNGRKDKIDFFFLLEK
jgi:hypothetical protein